MTTPARDAAHLSPNQIAKRDTIVAAAVEVLLRDGVHGCTARSIAAEAGVSKGTVHYYFRDVDEVVDAAMERATRAWITWFAEGGQADPALGPVRGSSRPGPGGAPGSATGARGDDRVAAFWASMAACLEPFSRGDRSLMPLWLEYWAARTRSSRVEPLRAMQTLLTDFVGELLESAGADEVARRATGVTAYLFGVAMVETIDGGDPASLVGHIAALAGLAAPDGASSPSTPPLYVVDGE